jgi:sigma-B regulation protein RsbU (phosphoserine phosphatase)
MTPIVNVQVLSARDEALGNTLASLRDFVSRSGRSASLSPRAIYNLKLAVDEIATNIVMYAYPDSSEDDLLTVTARIHHDRLELTLEDTGIPYDPRSHNEPDVDEPLDTREIGGLGVFFALNSVDDFDYGYVEGCNRNVFTMYRPLSEGAEERTEILLFAKSAALQDYLSPSGYQVSLVEERALVLASLRKKAYDLLIIDSDIAADDSFRLLKRLRVLDSRADMSILVIGADSDYITRCMELGASDFIRSPYEPNLLSLRIKNTMQQSPAVIKHRVQKLSQHIKEILLSDKPDMRFGSEMNIDHFLEHVLIEVQGIYNADAGTVYLLTEEKSLRFTVVRTQSLHIALGGTSSKEVDFPSVLLYDENGDANHHNVASHVALSGQTVNIPDIYENQDFDFTGTRWFDERNQYRSVSTLTVPLKDHTDTVVGVVQLINAQDESGQIVAFDPSQQMLVEALCAHTAVILSNFRLLQRQAMLAAIENDMRVGRRIQQDFMPHHIPEKKGWQIGARFYPAREVAGDFYDIFALDNYIVVILADVCDKGVGAALFMALIRSLLRAFIEQARETLLAMPPKQRTPSALANELRKVVQHTNDYILQHHYDLNMFATLFAGILYLQSGRLFYINGGHTPCPIIYHGKTGKIERLKPTGPAVGMFEEAWFGVEEIRLRAQDMIFAFTDGITDARNPQGEMLEEEAILALLPNAESVEDLLNRVNDTVFNHSGTAVQFDDITYWAVMRESETGNL